MIPASEVEVGMVIAVPDHRGYRVTRKRDDRPRAGWVAFNLARVDDPTDTLLQFIAASALVEVLELVA